jgi:glycosyltransferase involved in cell wall biosynthesis
VKVAFCAPFYGAQAAGGAEAECRKTAEHLHADGLDVEVFTTCLIDLQHDWNVNAHRPGTVLENSIPVHRFPAERSVSPVFAELNQRLIRGEALTPDEEQTFLALNINSTSLLRALAHRQNAFNWICFIPYLFGTTFHGIRLCAPKAILIPCLHNEGYARISLFRDMFHRARRIIFHTHAEQQLAQKLYQHNPDKDVTIGEGITTQFESNAQRFRDTFGIRDPFILCAGRRDATKNTPTLVNYFATYKKQHANPLKLVLIGPGHVPLPSDCPEIIDLGYVAPQDKRDAYSAATIFCQPSLNESFSIVIMEAWDCQTPALVHGHCAVLKEHALRSNGALWFTSQSEFNAAVNWLLQHPRQAHIMGASGQRYVRENFAWDILVKRYRQYAFA